MSSATTTISAPSWLVPSFELACELARAADKRALGEIGRKEVG